MSTGRELILIVEAEPASVGAMGRFVAKYQAHCDVVTCSTAEEAWRICEETPPTLVISAIKLPGQNGFSLCQALRKKGTPCCDTPIMLVSSRPAPITALLDALAAGAFAFESNPFSKLRFMNAVRLGLKLATARRKRHELKQLLEEVFVPCPKSLCL